MTEIRRQQIASFASQTPINSAVSITISAFVTAVLWPHVAHAPLLLWSGLIWGIALLQFWKWWQRRGVPISRRISQRTLNKAVVWTAAAGSLWGASIVFFPSAPQVQELLLIMSLGGMAAGASATLAALPAAAAAFILTSLSPGIIYFVFQEEPLYLALAGVGVTLTVAMLFSTRVVHRAFLSDIRTRQQNEALLRQFRTERAEWLEISDTSEAFALFDSDGRLLLWNEHYRQILGVPADRLYRGARHLELLLAAMPPSDVAEGKRTRLQWATAQSTLHETHRGPLVHQLADGRWIRSSARQTARGHIATLHVDITEHKTNEAALMRANAEVKRQSAEIQAAYEQLAMQHRRIEETSQDLAHARDEAVRANAAKSEFLANMSHELRTPLNAVIGFSQVMASQMLGPLGTGKYVEYSEDILNSGHHLLSLIDGILDLSKIEAGKLELVRTATSMEACLEASLRLVDGDARRGGVRLDVRGQAADWPALEVDEMKIKQILLNILSNAVKFTPFGGSVTIDTTRTRSGGFQIAIADTGIGMRAQDIPLVMLPFQRLEPAHSGRYSGTGLGLPLAKAFVELHGGHLYIASEPDRGTTVTIDLPRELDAAANDLRHGIGI
ncbi:MAG: ATP-binding protein [Inquilinaceae bacterium]